MPFAKVVRIAIIGLRSGQMTSGEAARATANQGRIDQQVRTTAPRTEEF